MKMGLWVLVLLCVARGAWAAEVVPAARVTDAAARALFGGGVPQGWRTTFRASDVPVSSAAWRLRAEAHASGERTRMAVVSVEVEGRVVRRIPVVFSAVREASLGVGEAVVHRGDSVKIVARRGTVACELAGEALRDGRRGERIQVRCGQRTMACIVAGPGEVEAERR